MPRMPGQSVRNIGTCSAHLQVGRWRAKARRYMGKPALKSWKFQPARRDGTPIKIKVTVEVSFAMDAEDLPGIQ